MPLKSKLISMFDNIFKGKTLPTSDGAYKRRVNAFKEQKKWRTYKKECISFFSYGLLIQFDWKSYLCAASKMKLWKAITHLLRAGSETVACFEWALRAWKSEFNQIRQSIDYIVYSVQVSNIAIPYCCTFGQNQLIEKRN